LLLSAHCKLPIPPLSQSPIDEDGPLPVQKLFNNVISINYYEYQTSHFTVTIYKYKKKSTSEREYGIAIALMLGSWSWIWADIYTGPGCPVNGKRSHMSLIATKLIL